MNVSIKNGFASDFVRDILLDREKNLWMATNDSGIFRLIKQVVTPFSIEQGLRFKNLYSILPLPTGEIWLGSFGGAAKHHRGAITDCSVEQGFDSKFDSLALPRPRRSPLCRRQRRRLCVRE